MSRLLLVLLFAFNFIAFSTADPIKKMEKVDPDKLAKECVEAFVKAVVAGKEDDAMRLCTTPFLETGGKVSETLDNAKDQFTFSAAGLDIKISGVITLDQFNKWAKPKGVKVLNAERLKQAGEFLGEDGRIVTIAVKDITRVNENIGPHFFVRIKGGKAKIVGYGHN